MILAIWLTNGILEYLDSWSASSFAQQFHLVDKNIYDKFISAEESNCNTLIDLISRHILLIAILFARGKVINKY